MRRILHYTITAELPEPLTTDQVGDALDALGDRYDSATIRAKGFEVDGSVRQVYGLTAILLDLRQALGWPQGLRLSVTHDPADGLGKPIRNDL